MEIARPFIAPTENGADDRKVTNLVANSYVKAVYRNIRRTGEAFEGCADVDRLLASYDDDLPGSGMALWRPELGVALAYLRNGEPRAALGQMLTALEQVLRPIDWALSFDGARPDILSNGDVYRGCRNIRSGAGGGAAIICDGGVTRSLFHLGHGLDTTVSGNNSKEVYVLSVSGERGEWEETIWPLSNITGKRLDYEDFASALADAFRLIDTYTPEYADWVGRALKGLAVFVKDDGTGKHVSGSSTIQPGVITVTMPIRHVALAETLVHECAHQYYHLLKYCYPFHDGTDDTLYVSPLKKNKRPLEMILLAFHASSHMAFFHKRLAENDRYADCMEVYHEKRQAVLDLEKALNTTHALTETGKELRDTLIGMF